MRVIANSHQLTLGMLVAGLMCKLRARRLRLDSGTRDSFYIGKCIDHAINGNVQVKTTQGVSVQALSPHTCNFTGAVTDLQGLTLIKESFLVGRHCHRFSNRNHAIGEQAYE